MIVKNQLANNLKFLIIGIIVGSLSFFAFQQLIRHNIRKSRALIEKEIKEATKFVLNDWNRNTFLKKSPPPQVLPVLRGSRIQGACGSTIYNIGNWDIGGSSYCSLTNTIFLVPEELFAFKKKFGISTIPFVVAHEFAHAIQNVSGVRLRGPSRELHADCIAGMFLKAGNKKLGITRDSVLSLAETAYSIGNPSHGTGAQRKYALLSGMGVLPASCSSSNMINLSEGKINDKYMQEIKQSNSVFNLIDISKTPFPKDFDLKF